jgi:hypothetical protein
MLAALLSGLAGLAAGSSARVLRASCATKVQRVRPHLI